MKYTPWFLGHEVPARPGVYQRIVPHGVRVFSYWDGTHWYCGQRSVQGAALGDRSSANWSVHQAGPFAVNVRWRGLTKEQA
jgi:hypothetical protein